MVLEVFFRSIFDLPPPGFFGLGLVLDPRFVCVMELTSKPAVRGINAAVVAGRKKEGQERQQRIGKPGHRQRPPTRARAKQTDQR